MIPLAISFLNLCKRWSCHLPVLQVLWFRPRRRLESNTGFNRRSSENNCITCLLTPCHVESRRFSLYIIALLQNDILSAVIALRKICDKIPSYVNLSICLLHERANYIGRRLRDRRTIDELHFRKGMVSIELTKYCLICSGFVVFFFGANCPEIGGELSRYWGGIVQILGGITIMM